ncbi:MAG: hypothetical protein JW990_07970 [Thermoleophilia bacterium]|nr:hypothetical protein [Thermoleophilia bacterium]
MAKRLTRLQVDEVSVVDKAANGKRFLILKRAREALSKTAGNSGQTTEVDDMTAEEIKKAIADGATQALAPVTERIDKLEAALSAPDDDAAPTDNEPVEKSETPPAETPTAEDIAKMVTAGVTEALKPLADRIEKLESIEGVRQSGQDDEGAHQVAKSAGGYWEGSGVLL